MSMLGEAMLLVQDGAENGSSVPLTGGMVTFGRAPLNDVVVEERGVSRQHAGIRGDPEGFWIADLGSRNGTFVNGQPIGTEPRLLRNFDRIELGGTDMPVH